MKLIKGDLLEGEWDCAMHCANVHQTMGSGIAYFLRKKWPIVYEADLIFGEEEKIFGNNKLGLFSKATVEPGRFVYNLYGQVGIGNDGTVLDRNCQYDHLYNAMYRACGDYVTSNVFQDSFIAGIPKNMGCCRAGGSWIIVEAMLKDLELRYPVEFWVYEFGEETSAQSSHKTLKDISDVFETSKLVGCDDKMKNK
jgi:hypothetical protein